jgi:hypothetical protein
LNAPPPLMRTCTASAPLPHLPRTRKHYAGNQLSKTPPFNGAVCGTRSWLSLCAAPPLPKVLKSAQASVMFLSAPPAYVFGAPRLLPSSMPFTPFRMLVHAMRAPQEGR